MMKDNSLLLDLLKHIHSYPCPVYYIYNIPTNPDKTIQFVEFDYDCRFRLKSFAWLRVDCESTDIRYLTEFPCAWKLNRKVRRLKLIANTCLCPECVHTEVEYEQEEWIPIAPGASYPLPDTPPEITHVRCEVKTDPGMTSILVLGSVAFLPDKSMQVEETPNIFEHSYSIPVPASDKRLFNTGSSTIYIRNLTTEYTEEWTELAPNASYPLPTEPPEISKVTFEAKTDTGMTSAITLFAYGVPVNNAAITATPATLDWDLAATTPIDQVSLTNTGSSIVYIRNLTTE